MPKTAKEKSQSSKLFLSVCALILFLLSVNNLTTINKNKKISTQNQVLGKKTQNYDEERNFWQAFTKKNPGYIEGWISLSKIEYKLGNFALAKTYFEKARQIDPNHFSIVNFQFED